MFEAAGDLGLEQKPGSTGWIVGVAIEDLLERHLAIQLGIECHEHRPQAPLGVWPQHAEPLAFRGRCADGMAAGTLAINLNRRT